MNTTAEEHEGDVPDRCDAIVPKPHAQADARCEREPHADGNHRVAPKDGKPGAVWPHIADLAQRIRALNLPAHHRAMIFDATGEVQAFWADRPEHLRDLVQGYETAIAAGARYPDVPTRSDHVAPLPVSA